MMEGKHEEVGPTKKDLRYLKTLQEILPRNFKRDFKRAVSELNFIKGVKKRELINFITSVYDLEKKQVARAVALGSKRKTDMEQTRKAQSHKRKQTLKKKGTHQPRYCTKKKNPCVLSKAKKRTLTKINKLCGICGGSKPKCEKKKTNKCKKKKSNKCKKKQDPCKRKKRRRTSSCKKRKPSCKSCNYGPGQTKRVKRDRYIPSDGPENRKNSVHELSSGGPGTRNSNEGDAKQTKKDERVNEGDAKQTKTDGVNVGSNNSKERTKPESERQKPLYIA